MLFTQFVSCHIFCQTGFREFSLSQAIQYAMQNGYTLRNASTDIEIAKKKVTELRGIGIPQLKADASFQNFLQVPVSLIAANAFDPGAPGNAYLRLPFGLQYNLSYGYTASWLLFSGEYLVGLQASKTYVDYTRSELRKSEIEVREGVTRAYHTILVLKENKKILQESMANLDKSIMETQAVLREGFIEEMDLDRLKLLRNNLSTTLNNLHQQKNLAEKLLKFQMGLSIGDSVSLTDSFENILSSIEKEFPSEPRFEFASSAESQLIELGLRLQELSRKRMQANFLPTLSTFYSWKENRITNQFSSISDPGFRVPGGTLLGLNFSIPVFQGLSQRSRVQQADLELMKIKNSRQQASQGYVLKSEQALSEFNTALNSLKDSRESVTLAMRIRDKSGIKFREGIGSSVELIQAENELLSAQGRYITSAMQLFNAHVTLNKQLNRF